MQQSPIQLGAINLLDFEIPGLVRFGGRQRLAVHALSGGGRIIERLGPDDDDIQFSGTFSGPNAEARVRAFDNLRLSGDIVWLTWESFRRQVIVRKFTADYVSPWWIHYRISCVVVYQNKSISSSVSNIAALVATSLSNAMSMELGSGVSLSSLQVALSAANSLTAGTADQTQAVSQVDSTMVGINSHVDQQSTALTTPFPTNSPATFGQSFLSGVNSARLLAATVCLRSYVGQIGANVGALGI